MEYFKITGLNLNRDLGHEWRRLDRILHEQGATKVVGNPEERFYFASDDLSTKMLSYVIHDVIIVAYASPNPFYAGVVPSVRGDLEINAQSASRQELGELIEKLKESFPVFRESPIEALSKP